MQHRYLAIALYVLCTVGALGFAFSTGDTQKETGALIFAAINVYLAGKVVASYRQKS